MEPKSPAGAPSPELVREYNAFGPWMQEIGHADEMPPVFKQWHPSLEGSDFLLKLPIDKERRLVRPGMDLYRQVVAVDAKRIRVLSLDKNEVSLRELPLSALCGIANRVMLLDGRLAFLAHGGVVLDIRYNAVSQDLVNRMVDFVRAQGFGRCAGPAGGAGSGGAGSGDGVAPASAATTGAASGEGASFRVEDYYFTNVARAQLARNPALRRVWYEEPDRDCLSDFGFRRRTLGVLVLGDGRELAVLHRGRFQGKPRESVHESVAWHLPRSALLGAEAAPEPRRPGQGRALSLRMDGHELCLRVHGGAEGLLAALRDPAG